MRAQNAGNLVAPEHVREMIDFMLQRPYWQHMTDAEQYVWLAAASLPTHAAQLLGDTLAAIALRVMIRHLDAGAHKEHA